MIRLYARAISSKDKNSLLKVAQDANDFYLKSYKKRYLYYINNFQALIYNHYTHQECWIITSNINGRIFKESKLFTTLSFISLPFFTVSRPKEEAFLNLFHYFFSRIYPVSDISTKFVKNILQVPDQYINISTSILLSFLEVMNIRIFSTKNKKINILEIFLQTVVTTYSLNIASNNFNTFERVIPNKLLRYIFKRIQIAIFSSFINLVCSIGFSNGMRISFERWLFSLFKIFKTHFNQKITKIGSELNSNDNITSSEAFDESMSSNDITYRSSFNFFNNLIEINNYFDINNDTNIKNNFNNENINNDKFINFVDNGKNKQNLLNLNDLQKMTPLDLIKNAYNYKVNVVIPPKQLQCSICHHLLHKPVESYGYFFCQKCIKNHVYNHKNKSLKQLYAKNPITGHFITQNTLYQSPFMNYIVYRYKLFLLDDCVEEYKNEQTKRKTP